MTIASILRAPALCSAAALLMSACSHLPDLPSLPSIPSLKPYRIDIQQGNFLSQEMVSQLKRGMTREQVRFVLGSPLVTDIFHADRWDYVFYREVPGGAPQRRHISVFFEDDRLARVEGDVNAAGADPPEEGGKEDAKKTAAPGAKAPPQGGAKN